MKCAVINTKMSHTCAMLHLLFQLLSDDNSKHTNHCASVLYNNMGLLLHK